jgi:hypothetical protein
MTFAEFPIGKWFALPAALDIPLFKACDRSAMDRGYLQLMVSPSERVVPLNIYTLRPEMGKEVQP